jgi:hypothetical protein
VCWLGKKSFSFFTARQAANRETHLVACPSSRKNYSWAFFSAANTSANSRLCHCGCFSWAPPREIRNIAGLAHYVGVHVLVADNSRRRQPRQRIWMWSDWINKYIMLSPVQKKSLSHSLSRSLSLWKFDKRVLAFCLRANLSWLWKARAEWERNISRDEVFLWRSHALLAGAVFNSYEWNRQKNSVRTFSLTCARGKDFCN